VQRFFPAEFVLDVACTGIVDVEPLKSLSFGKATVYTWTPPPVQAWTHNFGLHVWLCPYVRIIHRIMHIYIQTSIRVMNPFIQRSTNAYNFIRLGAAMNSVAGTAMDITVDSVSIAAINSRVGAHLEHTSTPQPTCSPRITVGYKEHLNIFCLVC
jgi:hypothetical protein